MKTADELRAELAALEGKQAINQPTPAAESEEQQMTRIFNAILGLDGVQERQRIEDQTMQVCASCFTLQPKTNTACELCGDATGWLVPSEVKGNHEYDMFSRMASDYSVEQLRIALTSGWARTAERQRVAQLILVSREAKLATHRQDSQAERPDEDEQPSALDSIDLKKVESYYDRQLAAINEKLSQLEQQGQ